MGNTIDHHIVEKQWIVKDPGDELKVKQMAEMLSISFPIANLLVQRDINSYELARDYFKPKLENLHDPFLMKDMERAVSRLVQAVDQGQKVLIYGDYDVDGTTSVAMMYLFLANYVHHIEYYIPDRYEEGYGISEKGVRYAADNGFDLMITLDCGIKAIRLVKLAQELGVDVIICDHHTSDDNLPEAYAVLDPKRPDCTYPFKELSGCGVGFKLLSAFCYKKKLSQSELYKYLEFVTVSIASDIVPVVGENRILAYYGLKLLNQKPYFCFSAIKKIANIEDKPVSISDIVFKIGPRINAAGRIETGRKAVDLLISENFRDAFDAVNGINDLNNRRKELDTATTQEALKIIGESDELRRRKTTVLFKPEWHKGVIGIVASRLTETYYRPTVVLTESNGYATGSARSVEGYDVYSAIESCQDLLVNFGGHKYAAGLTMKLDKLDGFTQRFEQYVENTISADMLTPKVNIDTYIAFEDITPKFFRILQLCQPYGPCNMTPFFATTMVRDTGYSRAVGKDKSHLKLSLQQQNGTMFNGIAFGMGHLEDKVRSGAYFDVCYTIVENSYQNRNELQLMVRDIKFFE